MDFETQLHKLGCSKEYEVMEACLGEHDRDWRQCQEIVKVFKLCMRDKVVSVKANVDNKD